MDKTKNKKSGIPELNILSFVHQPHDKYVRFVLQIRDLAQAFLQFALDSQVSEMIEWDSLALMKDSFIDEKLRSHFTDISYAGLMKTGKPVRVITLIEHKSDAPAVGELLLQLGRYIFHIWQEHWTRQESFPLIVPIVLYHGTGLFVKDAAENLFPDLPPQFLKYIPTFEYDLVDLNTFSDETLDTLKTIYLSRFLLALKHSRNEQYIEIFWKKFIILAAERANNEEILNFSIATAMYMSATSQSFNKKIMNMENLLSAEEALKYKPYFLELYEKGVEEGIEKGIQEGIEKGIMNFIKNNPGWSDAQVAAAFEIEVVLVQKIRAALINNKFNV